MVMELRNSIRQCFSNAMKVYGRLEPILKVLKSINVKWRPYQPYVIARVMTLILYSSSKFISLNSPTGSGKTLMVLASTIPLLNELNAKLIVAIRTRNQMNMYVKELKRFFRDKKFSVLIAKKDSCPMYGDRLEGMDIDCRICPLKNRINEKIILTNLIVYNDVQEAIKKTFTSIPPICPYHSMKKAVEESDVVIVSYPYVFDKRVREATIESLLEKSILVIDEAHNIDKLPDMVSIIITRGILEQAIRQVPKYLKESKAILRILNRVKEKLTPLINEAKSEQLEEVEVSVEDVITDDELLMLEDTVMEIQEQMILNEELETNWLRRVVEFLKAVYYDRYRVYRGLYDSTKYLVAKPVEPKQLLRVLALPRKVIFMSGTLPKKEYVKASWGIDSKYIDVEKDHGPVFPCSIKKWIIVLDVTSRYSERTHSMTVKYSELICKVRELVRGGILVVVPSYVELEKLRNTFPSKYLIFFEGKKTTLEEASRFIREHEDPIVVAVSMGKLVEGIEFTDPEGRSLINIIIFAGLPYPKPDDYLRLRLEMLAKNLNVNYFTALKYYTATSIKQAIGRLIRRDGDKALIILADRRFNERLWLRLLDVESNNLHYATVNSIDRVVRRVWY